MSVLVNQMFYYSVASYKHVSSYGVYVTVFSVIVKLVLYHNGSCNP